MFKLTIRLQLLVLAVPLLVVIGCSSDGAGGASELNGTWTGSFLEGGIPAALSDFRFLHSLTGTISATLTEGAGGTVSGTITMDPDICAEGATETAETITVDVSGALTTDTLSFSYTSPNISPAQDVTFLASFPADPIIGDYDGAACDPTWIGGFRLTKQ